MNLTSLVLILLISRPLPSVAQDVTLSIPVFLASLRFEGFP